MVDFAKLATQISTSTNNSGWIKPPASYGVVNKHGVFMQLVVTPDMEGDNANPPFETAYTLYRKEYKTGVPLPHDKQLTTATVVQAIGIPTKAAVQAAGDNEKYGALNLLQLENLYQYGTRVIALQMSSITAQKLFEQLGMGYEPAKVTADGSITYGTWFQIKLSAGKGYDVTPMPPNWKPESVGLQLGSTVTPLVDNLASGNTMTLADVVKPYAAEVVSAWEADAPAKDDNKPSGTPLEF